MCTEYSARLQGGAPKPDSEVQGGLACEGRGAADSLGKRESARRPETRWPASKMKSGQAPRTGRAVGGHT